MSTIHSVEADPRQKAKTTASVAKAQAENQSGMANRQQQSTSLTAKKRRQQRHRPRNVDCRTAYEKRLFSMAKRPLYDLLPRNSEIHNFTSMHLTDRQRRIIGLGLKFRPMQKPLDLTQFNMQIQNFCRSVRLHKKLEGEPEDSSFNSRLNVKSTWNPPREDPDLEDKLRDICKDLRQNIKQNKPHWKRNLSVTDREELNQIKNDDSVRALDTDKNLGPALVSTDWVKNETLRQVNDKQSYSIITYEDWILRHGQIIATHEKLLLTFSKFITANAAKFLRRYDHLLSPTEFYIIPKIHKNPIAGRPIAASHSFITRPLSIFVDEYVKPGLKMPTVLRDSGELIQALESVRLPTQCFLVTEDAISLYPNVDTKKALLALDLLLREGGTPETPLLIQFSRLVFQNNFLKTEFCEDIFHFYGNTFLIIYFCTIFKSHFGKNGSQ